MRALGGEPGCRLADARCVPAAHLIAFTPLPTNTNHTNPATAPRALRRQRLNQLQAAAPPGQRLALRVEVEGGGCSGFQYKFRLDPSPPAADDRVFSRGGAAVVADAVSLEFLKGAVIEFEDSLMRAAFHIASNPNSESTCGCGSSFVAKG